MLLAAQSFDHIIKDAVTTSTERVGIETKTDVTSRCRVSGSYVFTLLLWGLSTKTNRLVSYRLVPKLYSASIDSRDTKCWAVQPRTIPYLPHTTSHIGLQHADIVSFRGEKRLLANIDTAELVDNSSGTQKTTSREIGSLWKIAWQWLAWRNLQAWKLRGGRILSYLPSLRMVILETWQHLIWSKHR